MIEGGRGRAIEQSERKSTPSHRHFESVDSETRGCLSLHRSTEYFGADILVTHFMVIRRGPTPLVVIVLVMGWLFNVVVRKDARMRTEGIRSFLQK